MSPHPFHFAFIKPQVSLRAFSLVLSTCLALARLAEGTQTTITGPVGSQSFSDSVTVLPNGNVVVTDPSYDGAAADIGAVHLYSADGTLISTLTGSTASDAVGSTRPVVLANGNFVIVSTQWDSGAVTNAGAVTWVSGTVGLNGAVSSANSCIGTASSDAIGSGGVTALANGHYVFVSQLWNNGSTSNTGAVTWGNGNGGTVGTLSSANSLIGSTLNDQIGEVVELDNGNYIVLSRNWDQTAPVTNSVGAVTWGSGTSGVSGVISSTNSLIGSNANDRVGNAVVTLANGHYVVVSSSCDIDGVDSAGAITWCDGSTGRTGAVTATNSLHGTSTSDSVGNGSVYELSSGAYVVCSPRWDNGATADVGAVTWCDGSTGLTGAVSSANSLTGSTASDRVGEGLARLSNGHYVVHSYYWDNGAATDAGAATWCDGTSGLIATVSASNSLVGSSANDLVGDSIIPLTNGHYVIAASNWSSEEAAGVGAVTWCNGNTGRTGLVSAENSLIGSTLNDNIGSRVTALSNGNYVVQSQYWDNGSAVDVGALTWANGSTGLCGVVSTMNSLYGSAASDLAGMTYTLANGHGVMLIPGWDNGTVVDVGAVVWFDGTKGITGPVSAANALVGSTAYDRLSSGGVTPLDNGNYVVVSHEWDNGSVVDAGAVTWCHGGTGRVGVISASNSLVGSATSDFIGDFSVSQLGEDRYAVRSSSVPHPTLPITLSGAVTLCDANSGTVGTLTAQGSNTIYGTVDSGGSDVALTYDEVFDRIYIHSPAMNQIVRISEAGTLALSASLYTVNEEDGSVTVTVVRSDGADGALAATLSTTTSGHTASAGSDYTALSSQAVAFATGELSKTVSITIADDSTANEVNETFGLALSGSDVSGLATAAVRILDNDPADATAGSLPTISYPSEAAHIGIATGGTLTITGSASDDRGISSIQISVNGDEFEDTALTRVSGKTADFSHTITPLTGVNVIIVRSVDTRGNKSAEFTRRFVILRALTVAIIGSGSVTSGYSPSSFREHGRYCSIKATPGAGYLFDGWTVAGPEGVQQSAGISDNALDLPTLTFISKEGLQLTARFVVNPYLSTSLTGSFCGSIAASSILPDRTPLGSVGSEDGTALTNATTGYLTGSVVSTGAFTAKLYLDGLTLAATGTFDANGIARFGATRETTLSIPRSGKPSLGLTLSLQLTGPTAGDPSGYVLQYSAASISAVSEIIGTRAAYSAANPVPSTLLDASGLQGTYTGVFLAKVPGSQLSGLGAAFYPQGDGFLTAKLTPAGALTFTGKLADGTAIAASTKLSAANTCSLYASLYGKRGFIAADILFNPSLTNYDFLAPNALWLRPIQDTQHYPAGWPTGIQVDLMGAKYAATTGQSALPALPTSDADGNADLDLNDGNLSLPLRKTIAISTTDTVTNTPADTSFTLRIARTTGLYSGTFLHSDGTRATYQGVIHQKGTGTTAGGYGYFLTTSPSAKDYTGQSGWAGLSAQ